MEPQFLISNYDMCLRRELGYCSVCYSTCNNAGTNAVPTPSFATDTQAGAMGTTDCTNMIARIFIMNSAVPGVAQNPVDVYCGNAFGSANAPFEVCTADTRITIDFFSAANTVASDAQRGVCLDYRQIPC